MRSCPIGTPERTNAEAAILISSLRVISEAGRSGRGGPSSARRSLPASRFIQASTSARKKSAKAAQGKVQPSAFLGKARTVAGQPGTFLTQAFQAEAVCCRILVGQHQATYRRDHQKNAGACRCRPRRAQGRARWPNEGTEPGATSSRDCRSCRRAPARPVSDGRRSLRLACRAHQPQSLCHAGADVREAFL